MDTLILNEDLVGFPVYIPQQERLINETDVYFRPSSLPGKCVRVLYTVEQVVVATV